MDRVNTDQVVVEWEISAEIDGLDAINDYDYDN